MTDVLGAVLSRKRTSLTPALAAVGALVLHGAVASAAIGFGKAQGGLAAPEVEMVALPPPVEPPPVEPPPVEPPKAELKPEPEPAPPSPQANVPPTSAAAPAAAAAAVLAAPDDSPVDLTNSMVVGSAETYAGGVTSSVGKGTTPGGYGAPASTGTGSGRAPATPSPPAPVGPDRSRRPQLAEGVSWRCPFPAEADQSGMDAAVVRLSIEVEANGAVRSVVVESEPGSGFGREAAQCARAKRFQPALDRNGTPVPGSSRVNVRFER